MLSQWIAYGQDGEVIAIGFNYKELKALNKNTVNMEFSLKDISIEEVIYKEKKQKNKLSALIQGCIMYMQSMFEDEPAKIYDNL